MICLAPEQKDTALSHFALLPCCGLPLAGTQVQCRGESSALAADPLGGVLARSSGCVTSGRSPHCLRRSPISSDHSTSFIEPC